jgi:hypothetical protein
MTHHPRIENNAPETVIDIKLSSLLCKEFICIFVLSNHLLKLQH